MTRMRYALALAWVVLGTALYLRQLAERALELA
jgi:hypothetical protein